MLWMYAIGSALFADLTAVLAKIGIRGVDTDLATAIRTIVILAVAWSIVFVRGGQHGLTDLTWQNWLFLILSGVATGLSWIYYRSGDPVQSSSNRQRLSGGAGRQTQRCAGHFVIVFYFWAKY